MRELLDTLTALGPVEHTDAGMYAGLSRAQQLARLSRKPAVRHAAQSLPRLDYHV